LGVTTNPDGDTVYNEGSLSGQVASVVQNNYAGCASVANYTGLSDKRYECNLVWAHSSGVAVQDGDSGGPMVRWIGGQMYLTGIVSAGNSKDPAPCTYNTQYSNVCSHDVYYTAATEIFSKEYPGASIP
jgi:hypothetical protein